MIQQFRVIANDRKTALASAAQTLKNDPALQDWWLCVSAYMISAFLMGNILSDTWHRYLLTA